MCQSRRTRLQVNQSVLIQPAYAQQDPDLSGIPLTTKAAEHPRALQRQGRRDLYAETWGLTVEHQLPASLTASAQYLGSRGVRLFSRGVVDLCTQPVTLNEHTLRRSAKYLPGTYVLTIYGDAFSSYQGQFEIGPKD